MRTHTIISFISFTLALITGCALLRLVVMKRPAKETGTDRADHYLIIIDAGHGGMDGGAVGVNGVLEKDLNLSVAKKLSAICSAAGVDNILTRTEDAMLVDDSVKSHRKMHDLKNRVSTAEGAAADGVIPIFISIHMNNFPSDRYSGLQVWYSKNDPRGSALAIKIQETAKTYLDPSNDRQVKAAGSSIYVLDRIRIPAVLVECGFLSNPGECEKLCSDSYQTQLAAAIFAGIAGFTGGE